MSFLPSIESFAKGTAATAAGLSTVGIGLLYYGQNYLIYPSAFPPGSRIDVPTPTDFGLPYSDLTLTTSDGVKLKAYLLQQKPKLHVHGETPIDWHGDENDEEEVATFASLRPTVMMFHGNGGNHGHRIPLARVFFVKMRCNVLMVSYRGYGRSEGSPSEKGLQIDAQTGLDYVLKNPVLRETALVLYGQSIGGAVSIDLASKNPDAFTAMILENTFTSLPRLIPTTFPILSPFSFLCHQKWESYLKIPKIPKAMRMLLLGGERDEVVPHEHMNELWQLVKARRTLSPSSSTFFSPSSPSPSPSSSSNNNPLGGKERSEGEAATDENNSEKPQMDFRGNPVRGLPGTGTDAERVGSSGGGGGERRQPKVNVCGEDKYLEFPSGSHNDTCVQPGYWTAVAEFVASLKSRTRSGHQH